MDRILLHQFAEKLELARYSDRSIKDYPYFVGRFFDYMQREEGLTSLRQIAPEHLTAYHTHIQYSEYKPGKYRVTSTVRILLGAVKTFYHLMAREGLIADDLSRHIVLPKRAKRLPKNIPGEKEMTELLDTVQPAIDTGNGTPSPLHLRNRAILELLYATGIRNKEIRELTTDDVDLTERTLFVRGKGSKDRILPIGDWVIPWLMEYLEVGRPQLLDKRESTSLLFVSKNGRMITQGNLGDMIRKQARKSSIDQPLSPHSFRHAFATHMLKGGADIRYVQEMLGHSELSTTQIYTRVDISMLKKAHKNCHPREKHYHDDS